MKILFRTLAALLIPAGIVLTYFIPGLPKLAAVQPITESVNVEPLPLQSVCPGSLIELGGAQGTDLGAIARLGEPGVFAHGSVLPEPSKDGVMLVARGANQSTELLAANQIQSVDRARLFGLAATNCPQPQSFGYLVAGSSGPGNESVLILSNPNPVELLVEIELYLDSETVTERIPLAAFEHKLVPLVALSGAQPNYVLSFRTAGLPVAAFLQHRSVSGLAATGVAITSPQQALESGVIHGIEVPTADFEPQILRVLNPGLEPAELFLQLHDGTDFDLVRLIVPAGQMLIEELSLGAGEHLIFFESNQPVVLGIFSRIFEPSLDFAWFQPATLFQNLTIPVGVSGSLFLANPGVEELSVMIDGDQVRVPGRSQVSVQVTPGTLRISATAEFAAIISIRSPSGYDLISPSQMRNFGEELQVTLY